MTLAELKTSEMAREAILILPAGRELDARVAEIMGWKPSPMAEAPWEMEPPGSFPGVEPVPYFSTNIAAAWDVLEKVIEIGWAIEYHPTDGGWWVDDNHAHRVQANAPTAPLAICRAALLAKR